MKVLNFHSILLRNNSYFDLILLYITYLLIPYSRVLIEKLTGVAANQEIPYIYGTRKSITVFTSARHPSLSQSQLHPVPTNPSHFLKIRLNIILPSTSWSTQRSLSLKLPYGGLIQPETCTASRDKRTLNRRNLRILLVYKPSYVGTRILNRSACS
jgi:hypothetical protein